ncbi:unnamed protein product, partial [Ectocarpus sp. 4 AP-2014]
MWVPRGGLFDWVHLRQMSSRRFVFVYFHVDVKSLCCNLPFFLDMRMSKHVCLLLCVNRGTSFFVAVRIPLLGSRQDVFSGRCSESLGCWGRAEIRSEISNAVATLATRFLVLSEIVLRLINTCVEIRAALSQLLSVCPLYSVRKLQLPQVS